MAKDVNKIKKIKGKEIIADWSNIENKPDDLVRVSDIEKLASEEYVDNRFEELTGAAPEALDTLEELARALGEDENFSATIIEKLGNKQDELTFDDTPTEDSNNPVTSGGLFHAISQKSQIQIITWEEND